MLKIVPTFADGHEGGEFHLRVGGPHFADDFLEGVELAALCIHVMLVHLGRSMPDDSVNISLYHNK